MLKRNVLWCGFHLFEYEMPNQHFKCRAERICRVEMFNWKRGSKRQTEADTATDSASAMSVTTVIAIASSQNPVQIIFSRRTEDLRWRLIEFRYLLKFIRICGLIERIPN